jgi:hypothetical protein
MILISDVLKGELPGEIRIDELLNLFSILVISVYTFNLRRESFMTAPAFVAYFLDAYCVLNFIIL